MKNSKNFSFVFVTINFAVYLIIKKLKMLKVVGASWLQTRISTLIVSGALLIAISALFMIGMERPQYDGTYCATAYWNYQSSFRIEYWGQRTDLNDIAKGVARICYKDSIQQNGYSIHYIIIS